MANIVKPIDFSGFNMSIFGSPKWTITCGGCRATFKARVPQVDNPGIVCPHCGSVNILPIGWN